MCAFFMHCCRSMQASSNARSGSTMNQMIDVNQWGLRYALVAFRPNLDVSYRIVVIARSANTQGAIGTRISFRLGAGERYITTIDLTNAPVLLEVSSQVLVAQTSIIEESRPVDAPACLMVPRLDYLPTTTYDVFVPTTAATRTYITIVIQDGLQNTLNVNRGSENVPVYATWRQLTASNSELYFAATLEFAGAGLFKVQSTRNDRLFVATAYVHTDGGYTFSYAGKPSCKLLLRFAIVRL